MFVAFNVVKVYELEDNTFFQEKYIGSVKTLEPVSRDLFEVMREESKKEYEKYLKNYLEK